MAVTEPNESEMSKRFSTVTALAHEYDDPEPSPNLASDPQLDY